MPIDTRIGDHLLDLCASASQCVVLAAPFVKCRVIERVLEAMAPGVAIMCYTRWRPDEIAVGVSDLGVWELVHSRESTSLWLMAHLHAKYYRADDRCIVGSANLTDRALGWGPQPNLELVVSVPACGFQSFEARLQSESVPVDETVYRAMLQAVEALGPPAVSPPDPAASTAPGPVGEGDAGYSYGDWLPSLRHPQDLYTAYRGRDSVLSRAAVLAAQEDLAVIGIPAGLAGEAFSAYVGALLLQHPIVRAVDEAAAEPQRFGAMRDLLRSTARNAAARDDPDRAWQTLMRWLLYFLPERYRMDAPRHSEVFARR